MTIALLDFVERIKEGISVGANPAETDLIEWGRKYLPHYLTMNPSAQHKRVASILLEMLRNRGSKIVIEGPRDSAKSVWCTLIYPLYCVCTQSEEYIQIFSDSAEQSEKYLEAIKSELEDNAAIARDYPFVHGPGPRWQVKSILTRNGVRIDALSTGKKIRGRREKQFRPSLIIVDDPENEDHVYSALRRERNRVWFHRAVEKSGQSGVTNFLVIGTGLHRQCLIKHLGATPGWKHYLFKSVIRFPERMDLWARWKDIYCRPDDKNAEGEALAFYEKNKAEMERGAVVLWPEREPLYSLMIQWAVDRNSFESEKQNNPVNPEACEFPPDYFEYRNFWFDEFPESISDCVITLDPSKGKDAKRGDYGAITILKRGNDGYFYVDAKMRREPSRELLSTLLLEVERHHPRIVGIEANQFQELLADDFSDLCAERDIYIDVVPIDNSVAKRLRVSRIGPYLSRRSLRFRRSTDSILVVDQLRDFPHGDHDDGPDSLEMALRLMNVGDIEIEELNENTEGWPE